jgi:hypothetical protein
MRGVLGNSYLRAKVLERESLNSVQGKNGIGLHNSESTGNYFRECVSIVLGFAFHMFRYWLLCSLVGEWATYGRIACFLHFLR